MFPLKDYKKIRRTYTHGVKTFYSNFHLGEDLIVSENTPILAPFDCIVEKKVGKQSGNACYCYFTKYVLRFLHCNEVYPGTHKKGDVIALSGNTGLSTAPHIHLDISYRPFNLNNKNNFIDPKGFDWEEENMLIKGNLGDKQFEFTDEKWASSAERYYNSYTEELAKSKELKKQNDALAEKYLQLVDVNELLEAQNFRIIEENAKYRKEIETLKGIIQDSTEYPLRNFIESGIILVKSIFKK